MTSIGTRTCISVIPRQATGPAPTEAMPHTVAMGSKADHHVHGEVADGFGTVADEFRSNFGDRKEVGGAITTPTGVFRENAGVQPQHRIAELSVGLAPRSTPGSVVVRRAKAR